MSNRMHGVRGVIGIAALGLAFATPAHAQSAFDARWQAWFGCWQANDLATLSGAKPSAICVSPLNTASAVEVTMIQDGAVTSHDTIDASGVERAVDKQGCKGTESGRWSADNRRVFVHSVLTCEGGLARSGNTIVAMTPSGEWLNVQTLTVGKTTGVRAIHYHDAGSLSVTPASVAQAINGRQLAISAARTDAGTALDIPAVREAVTRTDTAAVQSWIVERGTRFNLSAQQLVALADAGIPGSVTDVMIGVSYPDHFALKASQPAGGVSGGYADASGVGQYGARSVCTAAQESMYGRAACDRSCSSGWDYDPFFYSSYGSCALSSRYGYYSPYSRYYGYPYGYGYGSYYPYYGYSTAPVVVVKGEEQRHGRVVNGHGYTQHPASTGQASDPFPSSSRSGGSSGSSSSGSYSGSGSSGGSSSSSGSSSSGGEQRTAHPRPPV